MEKTKLGLALCGSYCTYDKAFMAAEELCRAFDVVPIMSETASATDSRFGRAEDHIKHLEELTGKKVVKTIADVEPLAPAGKMDVLLILSCTGNTMSKMSLGITDSAVLMAAKGMLRNGKPVVIGVSTNDGLSGSAPAIAALLNKKNIYFVPFNQDDPVKKPFSLASDFELAADAVDCALKGRQLQPIFAKQP